MKIQRLIIIGLCLFIVLGCTLKDNSDNGNTNPGEPIELNKRLEGLIRVWGFLKYYHNEVASSSNWDDALLAAVPAVKNAEDFDSFNTEISRIIEKAGKTSTGKIINQTYAESQSTDDLFKWIDDASLFNTAVIQKLKSVKNDHQANWNYYVQFNFVGVPSFLNEQGYASPPFPAEDMRILALARYWNIINYFYPYKDGMPQSWDEVLKEFIPRLISVSTELDYHLTMGEFLVHITDSHGVYSGAALYSYFGSYWAPFEIRYIENKTIVTRVFSNAMIPQDAVKVGDIILKCNHTDIDTYRDNLKKYTAGSNEPVTQRNINQYILRGKTAEMDFSLLREGQTLDITVQGLSSDAYSREVNAADALQEKWKILPGNIGYVNMGILVVDDVDDMMLQLMETRAIIFDVRNYPQGTLYSICYYLVPEPVAFVKFLQADPAKPGTFIFELTYYSTNTINPDYYKGRAILLLDERTQSHAEFTCMALQTAPDCTIIGSQTSGADGNVTRVVLPGGITAVFTGLGVFYPDGTPTQRIGIVPDITVRPTIKGIQENRDEVLQKALEILN